MNHLQGLLLLVDGEIIRIPRREAPEPAQGAVQFVLGVLQIRDVLDLDLDHLHVARVQESGQHLLQWYDGLVVELVEQVSLFLQHADHFKGPLANHDPLPERRFPLE